MKNNLSTYSENGTTITVFSINVGGAVEWIAHVSTPTEISVERLLDEELWFIQSTAAACANGEDAATMYADIYYQMHHRYDEEE